MKTQLRKLYYHFRSARAFSFVLGLVVAFGVEQTLSRYGREWGPFRTVLTGLALVLAVFMGYEAARQGWRRLFSPEPVPMGDKPRPHRGLIFLLSLKSDETAAAALAPHVDALEYVWFLTTDRTASVAKTIERDYRIAHGAGVHFASESIVHHYRPEEACNALERAVSHARVQRLGVSDLIADVTGGTSAMTAGVIQGCLRHGVDLQMVAAQYDPETKEMTHPHEAISLPM